MFGPWSGAGHHMFGHEAGDRAPPAPASPFDTVTDTRAAAAPSTSARAVCPPGGFIKSLRVAAAAHLQAHSSEYCPHILSASSP